MARTRNILTSVLIITLAAGPLAADLLNRGFEAPSDPPLPGNYLTIGPGQERTLGFCNWVVESGTVDVVDAQAPLFGINWASQPTIDGVQLLDLNGINNGTIRQTFGTIANQAYTLTFGMTNNPLNGGPETGRVLVTDVPSGTVLLDLPLAHNNSTLTQPNWVTVSQQFTATGTMTRIRFISTTTPDGGPSGGLIIDGVSIPGVTQLNLSGDMTNDGEVSVLDIPDFIAALLGQPLSACAVDRSDVNGDTRSDGHDVQPFTDLLVP